MSGLKDLTSVVGQMVGMKQPRLLNFLLLEGEALAFWLELSEEEQENYGTAKEAIIKTMSPMEFISLDEFHKRKLRPGEALSVFVHDLKKLLEQAMLLLNKAGREPLLLHQFLAGVYLVLLAGN